MADRQRLMTAGTLAGVGASAWLCCVASVPGAGKFVSANHYWGDARRLAAVGVLVIPLAIAWFVLARCPSEGAGLERWRRLAASLRPALLLWAIPVALSRGLWKGAELPLLVFVGALALALERTLRVALPIWTEAWSGAERRLPSPRTLNLVARLVLVAGVAFYVLKIGSLVLLGHDKLDTTTSDLAEFDNLFFNALHGHPFRAPAIEGELVDFSALKVHAEFLLYALLPFYALRPGPQALLVLQTVIVAATAIPVYLFARRRVGEPAAAVFSSAFLLLPAVQRPNFYDFHFTSIGMLAVAWLLAFLDAFVHGARTKRQLIGTIVAFSCALLAREDVSVGLILVGVVTAVGTSELYLGAAAAALAAVWFVVIKFFVMPHFGTMWFAEIYHDLIAPGREGFDGVIATLLTNPGFVLRRMLSEDRLLYLLHLSVPLLFLWFRKPWLLLAALPGLPFTLLATNREPLRQISFQYVYHWIPYVLAASVIGLSSLRELAQRRAALIALLSASAIMSYHCGALLGARSIVGGFSERQFSRTQADDTRLADLQALTQLIPESASVAATEREGPHVSTRLVLYSLKFGAGTSPSHVLLGRDVSAQEARHVLQLLEAERYHVVTERGDFTLLERGPGTVSTKGVTTRMERIARKTKP